MRILYLHGYGDMCGGIIPRYLRDHGHELIEPDLPSQDFEKCIEAAQRAYDSASPDVVVGNSQGGAVAMNIETGVTPVVLVAPGWKYQGEVTTVKANTIVVNSRMDDSVTPEDCRELLHRSDLPESHLILAGEDHSMTDDNALSAILNACEKTQSWTNS